MMLLLHTPRDEMERCGSAAAAVYHRRAIVRWVRRGDEALRGLLWWGSSGG